MTAWNIFCQALQRLQLSSMVGLTGLSMQAEGRGMVKSGDLWPRDALRLTHKPHVSPPFNFGPTNPKALITAQAQGRLLSPSQLLLNKTDLEIHGPLYLP